MVMQRSTPAHATAAATQAGDRAGLLDAATMREVFAAQAAEFADGSLILDDCTVLGATKKLRKLIVEYRLRAHHAAQTDAVEELPVIGKAYARDRGAYAYAVMAALHARGFSADRGCAVPRPLAYLPEWRVLLQGKALGVQLSSLLYHPDRGPAGAGQAARWLARLHQSALPEELAPRAEPRDGLEDYGRDLAAAYPGQRRSVQDLLTRLTDLLGEPSRETLVPTHGDYHPKNIFLDGPTVTVIDFDTFALGEPARDLGYFLAQCAIMAYHKRGSFAPALAPIQAFLEGYRAAGLDPDLRRAARYVARAFFQSLHYELCVLHTGNHALIPVWLDQIAAWLACAADPTTPLPLADWR
ncbi:MAG: phosphotransferase [Chloroflexi bacterium]|nr:phosphotransferase [Chloroflexota bacterium]